jgi:branched-chain amino acid transport system ATP-binding protein
MFLEVQNITCKYGSVPALKDVSVSVAEGEVVALVGANGAGKSTLLRAISGLMKPASGEITFLDQRIEGKAPYQVIRRGIAHVPEGRLVFGPMTVMDNLRMGAYSRSGRKEISADLERVFEYFPVLKQRKNQYAGSLSGGEQQMVAVGRALMASPKLVLMDEPSMGLSPKLVETVGEIVVTMRENGLSVLLVEQNAPLALAVSSRTYVLEIGRVVVHGDSASIAGDERMKKAYLGGD